MKILSIHNEYLFKGGEDESRKAEVKTLEKFGEEVTSYIENNKNLVGMSKLSIASQTIWSKHSYNNIKDLLTSHKHDIVHVQNFFPLISPSVYYAARSKKVPIVQAVRNYRFICPNALLFKGDSTCEKCVGRLIPIPGVIHGCYRDSRTASLVATTMLSLHNLINSWRLIDKFVAISHFVKDKMIEGGFPKDKITVKPNFVYPDPGVEKTKSDYLLYVGRLSKEKGLDTLLNALKIINDPSIKLKIIGEGPLTDDVIKLSSKLNVELLGKKSLQETYNYIGKAKCLIVPSKWHEPFGRVVVEGFAKGTPVIGSRSGGIAELIEDDVTGFTFQPGNAFELAEKISNFYQKNNLYTNMGLNGRQVYLERYTSEVNYKMLVDIYQSVLR